MDFYSYSEAHIDEQISQNEFKKDHMGGEIYGVQHILISILQVVLRPNFFIFSLMQALQVSSTACSLICYQHLLWVGPHMT